jgi:hypothetical protein
MNEEFQDLGCHPPLVIAFGANTYKIASQYIPSSWYERLVRVTSFGQYISKEKYRELVLTEIEDTST